MSEKRRDSKGRILRNGEVQRADGKYMFRYNDAAGERRTVYSWKLVDTDPVPSGKKCLESLRSIEKRVLKDVEDGIMSGTAANVTVDRMFDAFLEMRGDLRESTRTNYIFQYKKHIKNVFGSRKVSSIKYSEIYKFYYSLHSEDGLMISSVYQVNGVLWQVLDLARKDKIIRQNPADGVMAELRRRVEEETTKQHALTLSEQSAIIEYTYSSSRFNRYGPLITTLLGTGMRIGELVGLRWEDVDFNSGFISVNHALQYRSGVDGKYRFRISKTKTSAAIRLIPILSEVRTALLEEKHYQDLFEGEFVTIDGCSGFVFTNRKGAPYSPAYLYELLNRIASAHNDIELKRSSRENRDPVLLPKIGPHIFRHTFCTRLCENMNNIKVIQEVMGHKDAATTMNIYNEATEDTKKLSFAELEGKIKLACNQ